MPIDPACATPKLEPVTLCALLLGRVQMSIARARDGVLPMLAACSIRESLMAALRQEGHAFTEERFFAWYAGLQTLSDDASSHLRPPRALCHAVLTELRHNPWPLLSESAERLQRAFLAPSDFRGGGDHQELHIVIEEGHAVMEALRGAEEGLPFQAVTRLFHRAMLSPRFAREERGVSLVHGIAAERSEDANCRWALDVLAGRYLAPRYGLPVALPLPGLVSLPLAGLDPEDFVTSEAERLNAIAMTALHGVLQRLDRMLEQAECDVAMIDARLKDRRSSGRARTLAINLAGFGSLTGRQIEQVIGVSRPGVRIVTAALEAENLTTRARSRNGTSIHAFAPHERSGEPAQEAGAGWRPSSLALDEYEASMRAIDDLLRRSSRTDLED